MSTPLAPLTDPVPPVPARVAIARFVVRSLCDSTGQPDTVLIVIYPWLMFAGLFFWRALGIAATPNLATVSADSVSAVLMITLALILWAAALKLGEGVFVPLAAAVAGAFRALGSAASGVLAKARAYNGGPDRTVGVNDPGGELARPLTEETPDADTDVDPPPMGADPAREDA